MRKSNIKTLYLLTRSCIKLPRSSLLSRGSVCPQVQHNPARTAAWPELSFKKASSSLQNHIALLVYKPKPLIPRYLWHDVNSKQCFLWKTDSDIHTLNGHNNNQHLKSTCLKRPVWSPICRWVNGNTSVANEALQARDLLWTEKQDKSD